MKYAKLLSVILICLFYCGGMPVLLLLLFAYVFFQYWTDKFLCKISLIRSIPGDQTTSSVWLRHERAALHNSSLDFIDPSCVLSLVLHRQWYLPKLSRIGDHHQAGWISCFCYLWQKENSVHSFEHRPWLLLHSLDCSCFRILLCEELFQSSILLLLEELGERSECGSVHLF